MEAPETNEDDGIDAMQRNIVTSESTRETVCELLLKFLSILLIVLLFPISLFFCMRVLSEYRRAVIFRLGRLKKKNPYGPGIIFIIPCIDNAAVLDIRTTSFDLEPQDVLTKDSVTIKVDAVVYFRIQSPIDAVVQVANYHQATLFLAQTTLRNVIGTKQLTDLLKSKGELSQTIASVLDKITAPWGIKVERVELTEISLPGHIQKSMAVEEATYREALAKVATAQGELSAAEKLKDAANVISQNAIALQLRYLQTITAISSKNSSTYIFPLPLNVLKKIIGSKSSGSHPPPPIAPNSGARPNAPHPESRNSKSPSATNDSQYLSRKEKNKEYDPNRKRIDKATSIDSIEEIDNNQATWSNALVETGKSISSQNETNKTARRISSIIEQDDAFYTMNEKALVEYLRSNRNPSE